MERVVDSGGAFGRSRESSNARRTRVSAGSRRNTCPIVANSMRLENQSRPTSHERDTDRELSSDARARRADRTTRSPPRRAGTGRTPPRATAYAVAQAWLALSRSLSLSPPRDSETRASRPDAAPSADSQVAPASRASNSFHAATSSPPSSGSAESGVDPAYRQHRHVRATRRQVPHTVSDLRNDPAYVLESQRDTCKRSQTSNENPQIDTWGTPAAAARSSHLNA